MAGTLSFTLDGGSERHYNVDRIAYLDANTRSTGTARAVLTGLLVLLAVGTFLLTQSIIATALPVIVAVLTYLMLRTNDGVTIGTTTDEDQIELNNIHELEAEFERLADDIISINGRTDGILVENDYRYHLAPKNIVSIERMDQSIGFQDVLLLLIAFIVPPVLGVIVFVIVDIAMVGGATVPITVFLGIVLTIAVYYRYVRKPSGVGVRLENGTTKVFEMTNSDAQRIVQEFQRVASE